MLQWFVELPLGGGLTNKKSKLVDVTHEAFLAMIRAVSRAPGEIIRVVLGDFGSVFCSTETEWYTSTLMLQLRQMDVVVVSLHHRCCQLFFPISQEFLYDCFVIFKPAFLADKELLHVKNLPHGLSGRQFTAAWKFATCVFDADAGELKNAFIFTKTSNALAYCAWLNTTTQFHCFKFASAANRLIQGEDVF